MLLVIFGAGASFDSCASFPASMRGDSESRLPLANQLFSNRKYFQSVRRWFPKILPITPRLNAAGVGNAVERELTKIQSEGDANPERLRQLASVKYYLQSILMHCTEVWDKDCGGVSNYKTLLDEITHCYRGPVCFVTFNYDRMIEDAFDSIGIKINDLASYISDPRYRLFKVHGSVNWARHVYHHRLMPLVGQQGIHKHVIDLAPELEVSDSFLVTDAKPPAWHDEICLYPSIAIPVEQKAMFECPKEHIDTLERGLKEVTKILIIGWRGTETHFLNMLRENLRQPKRGNSPQPLRAMIVSGKRDLTEEPSKNLESTGKVFEIARAMYGFSEFILSDEMRGFLRKD